MENQGYVLTDPKKINLFRKMTLLSGLGLEIKGLTKRGQSCYSIIKAETGLKGNKQKVYDDFKKIVDAEKASI